MMVFSATNDWDVFPAPSPSFNESWELGSVAGRSLGHNVIDNLHFRWKLQTNTPGRTGQVHGQVLVITMAHILDDSWSLMWWDKRWGRDKPQVAWLMFSELGRRQLARIDSDDDALGTVSNVSRSKSAQTPQTNAQIAWGVSWLGPSNIWTSTLLAFYRHQHGYSFCCKAV